MWAYNRMPPAVLCACVVHWEAAGPHPTGKIPLVAALIVVQEKFKGVVHTWVQQAAAQSRRHALEVNETTLMRKNAWHIAAAKTG